MWWLLKGIGNEEHQMWWLGHSVRMRTIVTKTNKNNTTTRGEQPSRTTRVTDEITEDGANVTLIETGTGSDATGTTDGAATLTDAANYERHFA